MDFDRRGIEKLFREYGYTKGLLNPSTYMSIPILSLIVGT